MSADAASRDSRPAVEQERLRQAGRRLRSAQEQYNKLAGVTRVKGADEEPSQAAELKPTQGELRAAEKELRAAKEEFLPLYARHLREDLEFRRKSEKAEQRLAEGPPWDDLITPSDLQAKGTSTDR